MSLLSDNGLIIKKPRRGMFVSDHNPVTDFSVSGNHRIFDGLENLGLEVRAKILSAKREICTPSEQEMLQLAKTDEVVRIERVLRAGKHPLALSLISFPAEKVPGMEKSSLEGRSFNEYIALKYQRRPVKAERWFSATLPNEEACKKAGFAEQTALTWLVSRSFEADGTPLEYYEAYYNSNLARIRITFEN